MLTFESFKNQKSINLQNAGVVNKFYALKYSETAPVFYHCLPLYNSFTNSSNFKYRIFDVCGDSVFVAYKVIQIMTTKQIRIFNTPISAQGVIANESAVQSKLRDLPFVRFCYSEPFEQKFQKLNRLIEYDDYYFNVNHHITNHKIQPFFENSNFSFVVTKNCSDVADIMKLYDTWELEMNACGHKVAKSSKKEFLNFITYPNEYIFNIVLYYKENPVSIRTIMLNNLGWANAVFSKTIRTVNAENEEDAKILKWRLRHVQNNLAFKLLKYYGINRLYVAGCRPTEKRLIEHKEKTTDGVIRYYID